MIRRERFILTCVNRVRGLHSREKLHDCAEGHPTRTSGSPHGQQTRDVVASRTDANERTVCDSDGACSGRENRKEVRAARAGNFGPSASQERSGLSSGGPYLAQKPGLIAKEVIACSERPLCRLHG